MNARGKKTAVDAAMRTSEIKSPASPDTVKRVSGEPRAGGGATLAFSVS